MPAPPFRGLPLWPHNIHSHCLCWCASIGRVPESSYPPRGSMPRPCIICRRPSVQGRSRCQTHGRGNPVKSNPNGARQNAFRRKVLEGWKPGDPCGKCGLPIWDNPDAGHIVPLRLGGTFHPSNGQPEHQSCNRAEGARLSRLNRG